MELFIFLNQLGEIGSFFKAHLTLSRGAPVCRGTVVEHPWSRNQHVRYRRPLYVQNRKCILMHPIVTTTTKTTTELFTDAHTRERSSHELLCKAVKKKRYFQKNPPQQRRMSSSARLVLLLLFGPTLIWSKLQILSY